jgi:hypothetical protein
MGPPERPFPVQPFFLFDFSSLEIHWETPIRHEKDIDCFLSLFWLNKKKAPPFFWEKDFHKRHLHFLSHPSQRRMQPITTLDQWWLFYLSYSCPRRCAAHPRVSSVFVCVYTTSNAQTLSPQKIPWTMETINYTAFPVTSVEVWKWIEKNN